jgi:hypothetical protein
MLIRQPQMTAISDAQIEIFEDVLVAHLCEAFPEHVKQLGEVGCRSAIRHGIARAGSYGIVTGQGVAKYIKLMFAFGRDFDCDPNYAWAARELNDVSSADPEIRADRVMEAALKFLYQTEQ